MAMTNYDELYELMKKLNSIAEEIKSNSTSAANINNPNNPVTDERILEYLKDLKKSNNTLKLSESDKKNIANLLQVENSNLVNQIHTAFSESTNRDPNNRVQSEIKSAAEVDILVKQMSNLLKYEGLHKGKVTENFLRRHITYAGYDAIKRDGSVSAATLENLFVKNITEEIAKVKKYEARGLSTKNLGVSISNMYQGGFVNEAVTEAEKGKYKINNAGLRGGIEGKIEEFKKSFKEYREESKRNFAIRARQFINDLITRLIENKFIGGAVKDSFKVLGLFLASKLAKFGPIGRALGIATYLLSSIAGQLLPALIADMIKANGIRGTLTLLLGGILNIFKGGLGMLTSTKFLMGSSGLASAGALAVGGARVASGLASYGAWQASQANIEKGKKGDVGANIIGWIGRLFSIASGILTVVHPLAGIAVGLLGAVIGNWGNWKATFNSWGEWIKNHMPLKKEENKGNQGAGKPYKGNAEVVTSLGTTTNLNEKLRVHWTDANEIGIAEGLTDTNASVALTKKVVDNINKKGQTIGRCLGAMDDALAQIGLMNSAEGGPVRKGHAYQAAEVFDKHPEMFEKLAHFKQGAVGAGHSLLTDEFFKDKPIGTIVVLGQYDKGKKHQNPNEKGYSGDIATFIGFNEKGQALIANDHIQTASQLYSSDKTINAVADVYVPKYKNEQGVVKLTSKNGQIMSSRTLKENQVVDVKNILDSTDTTEHKIEETQVNSIESSSTKLTTESTSEQTSGTTIINNNTTSVSQNAAAKSNNFDKEPFTGTPELLRMTAGISVGGSPVTGNSQK